MQLSPSSVSVNFNLTGLALPGFLPFATGTGGAPSGTAVAPADFTQMFPGLASAPAAVDQPLDELAITPKPQAAMDAASTIFAFWLPMMPVTPAPLPANDAEPAIAGEAVENDGASADSAVQEPGLRPETRNAHGWSRRDRAGLMRCETESPQDESNATKRETSPTMLPPLPVSVAVPSNERAEALTKEPVSPSSENPRLPQNAGVRGGISEIPVSPFEGSPTVGRGATAQKPISTRAFECEPPLEDGPSAVEPTAVAFSSISTNQLGFAATEKSLLTVEQSLPVPVLSSQPVRLQSRGDVRDVVTAFGAPVSPAAAIRFIPALQAEGEAQPETSAELVFSRAEIYSTSTSPSARDPVSSEVDDRVGRIGPRPAVALPRTSDAMRSPDRPLVIEPDLASISLSFGESEVRVATTAASLPETSSAAPIFESLSPPVGATAKTADSHGEFLAELETTSGTVEKEFLGVSPKRVTTVSAVLGTGIAKLQNSMSASTLPARHAPIAPDGAFSSAATASVSTELVRETVFAVPSESVSTTHQAVEAVLTAVDRVSAGDHHVVNLRFSVGGEDLDVRVEVRADVVQATFRTDSADLRSALSHEWQAANPAQSERSVRLAPPVFTSSDTPGFSSSSGEGSSRQREQAVARIEDPFAFSLRQNRAPRAAAANGSSAEPRSVLSAAGSALRLHAHA